MKKAMIMVLMALMTMGVYAQDIRLKSGDIAPIMQKDKTATLDLDFSKAKLADLSKKELSDKKFLENMKNIEGGKKASINEKKASGQELRDYFTKVLPEWDQDRVQNSHIKKLIQWYNILVKAGITDFEESMSPTEGDNVDDRK